MKKLKLIAVFLILVAALVAVIKQKPGKGFLKETAQIEEKPFVIVIPSYNNSAFCIKNLRSIYEQNYKNYRVIYIDDSSQDDTYEKVNGFIKDTHQELRTTLIHNTKNQGALANLYQAIHSCDDKEIIVTLDGDDFLAHEEVLDKLNRIYANPGVWLTYGNFVNYPTYTQDPVICKEIPTSVIKNNSYRKHEWVSSHLRTFYAGLFKKIKLEDLLYEGRFFPMAWDLPLMMPMLEMAGHHAVFVKDVLYLYNRSNPINDHKVNVKLQRKCAEYARSLPAYGRLENLPVSD